MDYAVYRDGGCGGINRPGSCSGMTTSMPTLLALEEPQSFMKDGIKEKQ